MFIKMTVLWQSEKDQSNYLLSNDLIKYSVLVSLKYEIHGLILSASQLVVKNLLTEIKNTYEQQLSERHTIKKKQFILTTLGLSNNKIK